MMAREFVVRAQSALGVDAAGLARLAGARPATVRAWRTGRYKPSGEAVLRIVNALLERGLRA